MKKHPKTLSLEILTAHQQRIRSVVRKVNEYSPTFHLNPSYNRSMIIDKIKLQRQSRQDQLFEQNMNIIEKLQSIGPKVNTKLFPLVNLAARSKRKCSSLSEKKTKKSPPQKIYKPKKEYQLLEENLQIIDKLQTIDKKIKCWQDKTLIKSRFIREKTKMQKRNQILQKFKQISKEMQSLKIKNSHSRIIQSSPYFTQKSRTKRSETECQTSNNSFILKKSAR